MLPRIRLAPGFGLVDQSGERFTSDGARGQVTLYSFAYGDCGDECADIHETMRTVGERVSDEVDLGGTDLRLVTISLDPASDAGRLDELAAATGADADRWRWAVTDPAALEAVVGGGFKVFFDPETLDFDARYVLVDGWGVVRGDYRYATLASDADKLVRHIGVLAEELRNSKGAVSIAYEAAHVFLCYP